MNARQLFSPPTTFVLCSERSLAYSLGAIMYLFATFMSDKAGAQILVITLTQSLHTGQKDIEGKRKEDVGKKQDKVEEYKQMGVKKKVAAKGHARSCIQVASLGYVQP